MGRNWPFSWERTLASLGITVCLSGLVSPKGLGALKGHHRPESVTTMLEPACRQLGQLESCRLGLPRVFINSFVEATCRTLSIFHTSRSRKFWRAWMNGKQPESGVRVCTWQRDGENLFSLVRPRRLSAITPAQMSLSDNNANNRQNSGDTACVVACV